MTTKVRLLKRVDLRRRMIKGKKRDTRRAKRPSLRKRWTPGTKGSSRIEIKEGRKRKIND